MKLYKKHITEIRIFLFLALMCVIALAIFTSPNSVKLDIALCIAFTLFVFSAVAYQIYDSNSYIEEVQNEMHEILDTITECINTKHKEEIKKEQKNE